MCRHRGNKLVWNDYPAEETAGVCRQFTCKYHGWRYDLEGELTFVQQESEFFDLDKADFGLAKVHVDVWEGFIFVNLDTEEPTPLREYMGKFGAGMEGYPFHLMTQVHKYRAEIGSNWKLFIDAFAEFYHAPILHAKQSVNEESRKLQEYGYEALAYDIDGPHGMVSSWGGMAPAEGSEHGQADRAGAAQRPVRRVGRPRHRARRAATRASTRPATTPGARTRSCSSPTSCCSSGSRTGTSRTTTGRRPTTPTSSRARSTSSRRRTPTSACSRSSPWCRSRSTACRTATPSRRPRRCSSRGAITEFPLNDQEVLLRQLHTTARGYVARLRAATVHHAGPHLGRVLTEEP